MKLYTKEEYIQLERLSERTFYRMVERGEIEILRTVSGNFVIVKEDIRSLNSEEIIDKLKSRWDMDLRTAHNIYSKQPKTSKIGTEETREFMRVILNEAEHYSRLLGITIRGYDKRSLQRKIKSGQIARKTRDDKFKIKSRVLGQEDVFEKSLELVSNFYIKDPLHSLNNSIYKAVSFAKNNEDFWEVAAVNEYTLRKNIDRAFKQSGMQNMHEYLNHFNIFRKKLAYTKGAFTNDIDFMDYWSLDDHKFDIAGVLVFDEASGKMVHKMLYSWVMIELKTMYPVAWMIKAEPFKEDDILRMIMTAIKKFGAPKKKVICDQGLAASERVKEFFNRLKIGYEAQPPYTPTAKAPNERIFKMVKEECDIFNVNFVGSNHPTEGRHKGVKLSPEETTELVNEAISRYDGYFNGDFIERPRKREIAGIEGILDNMKRVSIKDLFEHYYKTYEREDVSDVRLRYAFMKYDAVKKFENYYIKFRNEIYLPTTDLSLTLHDSSFRFIVAYDPGNLNTIDLYSAQDIMDRLTGDLIAKGQYVCSMESLKMLDAGEKKKRVAIYNKKINKSMLELTRNIREKYSLEKDLVNEVVTGAGVLVNIRKEQEAEITKVISESLPMDKIDLILDKAGKDEEEIDVDEALSEESFKSLDNLKID